MKIKKIMAALLAATLTAMAPLHAHGADYPNGPVRFIVGFTAGSSIDLVARIVGEALSARWGQSFVVENRTGANGAIAARAVVQAKPDGHTILVSNSSSITVNPLLFPDLGYDPLKDFAPVTTVVSVPFVLAINPENPKVAGVTDLASLIALAGKSPNHVSYGSAGNGNLIHLASAQLGAMAGVQMLHVPYRGAASMEQGLLAREVDFGFDTISGIPLMTAGKLKPLAVSTKVRWRDLPDVPAVAELGYPDFDVSFWVGIFAPVGTPPEIVARLNQEIAAISQDPKVRERLALQGNLLTQTPQAFRQKIIDELKDNQALIKRANIKVE